TAPQEGQTLPGCACGVAVAAATDGSGVGAGVGGGVGTGGGSGAGGRYAGIVSITARLNRPSGARSRRSAATRPVSASLAKYTRPPPSARRMPPRTRYRSVAAARAALSSSAGETPAGSPGATPEMSLLQRGQKRPQPGSVPP